MRLIGIDLGTKTMGIAITDSLQVLATGLKNFYYPNNDLNVCLNEIKKILNIYQNDIESIILGYPLNVDGTKNKQTLLVENFFNLLKRNIILPIFFQDERYSTIKATDILKYQGNLKSSQIKKNKDKMSAVVILDEYMANNQHD
ncbi:MAG: Holliday junction resolvase RuvX [Mycoplasmataceae bacterium]|jgi:putative Holliday junction resolvase|nr:Holliday junction resolvase RuvX [Mycoplasmataceae bacterium]